MTLSIKQRVVTKFQRSSTEILKNNTIQTAMFDHDENIFYFFVNIKNNRICPVTRNLKTKKK